MTPEERLAATLLKRRKLSPPIPVEELVGEYADVEYDTLPSNCDGVLLRRQIKKSRPLVIIDQTKPSIRRRFTLAHELGHLLIPWHIGTLSCHTSPLGYFGEKLYLATEAEANRFASELLVPSRWMRAIVAAHPNIVDAFSEVRKAQVSSVTACISLCKVLPPGHVFAAIDDNAKVAATARSVGTVAPLMKRRQRFDREFYDGAGGKISRWKSPTATIYWWEFGEVATPVDEDGRTATEILEKLLLECVPAEQRKSIFWSINGIIGAANSSYKPSTVSELLSVLKQRFTGGDSGMRMYSRHDDFDLFLRRRAQEIIAKRAE